MNLLEVTAISAARAAVIAIVAVALGLLLLRQVRRMPTAARRGLVAIGALAYFTPTMLAGYGWLPSVIQWPVHSIARELFYSAMLIIRLAPVAAIALWLARTGPTESARYVWKLAGGRGGRWYLREAGAAPWLAAGLVFLLAFQEFDLATSWGIRAWTVVLFDAQIGGLALGESLRFALLPIGVELLVIIPLLLALRRSRAGAIGARPSAPTVGATAWLAYAALPVLLFVALPGVFVFRFGADALRTWMETPSMVREMVHACISAGVAATLAWAVTALAGMRTKLALALPGLLGPLLLSLVILGLLEFAPGMGATVLPWLLGLTLQVLPFAMLLRLLLQRGVQTAALHTARLSGTRAIEWAQWRFPATAALLLLFCVAYGDFTIGTLLAPPQFTTIFPRIFNLMHYGQSAVLSFTVLVAVLTPLLVLGLTLLLLRLYVRRCVR